MADEIRRKENSDFPPINYLDEVIVFAFGSTLIFMVRRTCSRDSSSTPKPDHSDINGCVGPFSARFTAYLNFCRAPFPGRDEITEKLFARTFSVNFQVEFRRFVEKTFSTQRALNSVRNNFEAAVKFDGDVYVSSKSFASNPSFDFMPRVIQFRCC